MEGVGSEVLEQPNGASSSRTTPSAHKLPKGATVSRVKAVYIFVQCWRGCGRVMEIEPDRYSAGLVCGQCWEEN